MTEEQAQQRLREILKQFESSAGPLFAGRDPLAPPAGRNAKQQPPSVLPTLDDDIDDIDIDDDDDDDDDDDIDAEVVDAGQKKKDGRLVAAAAAAADEEEKEADEEDDAVQPPSNVLFQNRLRRAKELFYSGTVAIEQERWADAENDLENVDEMLRELIKTNCYDDEMRKAVNRGRVLSFLGFVRHSQGKLDRAVSAFEEGLSCLRDDRAACSDRAEAAELDRDICVATCNVAESLAFLQRVDCSVPHAIESLRLSKSVFGDEDPQTASRLSNLASYLCTLGKFDDAHDYAQAALRIFEQQLGRDNSFTVGALRNYYKLLEALGRADECDKLRAAWADTPDALKIEFNPAEHAEPQPDTVEKLLADWQTPRQVFDPEGFMLDDDPATQELRDFVNRAEADGVKLPPAIADMFRREYRKARDAKSPEEYDGLGVLMRGMTESGAPDFDSVPDLQNILPEEFNVTDADRLEFQNPADRKAFMKMGFEVKSDQQGFPILDPTVIPEKP